MAQITNQWAGGLLPLVQLCNPHTGGHTVHQIPEGHRVGHTVHHLLGRRVHHDNDRSTGLGTGLRSLLAASRHLHDFLVQGRGYGAMVCVQEEEEDGILVLLYQQRDKNIGAWEYTTHDISSPTVK